MKNLLETIGLLSFFEEYAFIGPYFIMPIIFIITILNFFLIEKKGYIYIYVCVIMNITLFLIIPLVKPQASWRYLYINGLFFFMMNLISIGIFLYLINSKYRIRKSNKK